MDSEERRRIERLEREVTRLRGEVRRLAESTWQQVPEAPPSAGASSATQPWPERPGPPQRPPPRAAVPVPPASSPAPATADRSLETLIGTRWLAVTGIVLFTVAAALFLRLAIVNDWIGPAAQIAVGVLAGLGLWGFGVFLDRTGRLGEFPHVLAGGGVAVTAFAVFAAHHFDTYRAALGIGLVLDTVLLAVVTLAALADATLRRAQAQAMVASTLGPVTALLALELTTFSLVLAVLMAFALLAAATLRRWSAVTVLSALGAYLAVVIHMAQDVEPGAALGAAGVLLLGFTAAGLRGRDARDAEAQAAVAGQVVAWVATWAVGLWAFGAWNLDGDWLWTLGLGLAAGGLAFVPGTGRTVAWTWGGLGIAGLVGFVPLLPWPEAVALGWLLELGALAGVRAVRRHRATTITAGTVLGLLLLRLVGREAVRVAREADGWGLDALLVGLAAGAAAAVWAVDARLRGRDAALARFHLAAAVGLLMLLPALALSGPVVSLVWGLLAITLVGAGFAARRGDLRVAGLAAFGLTVGRILVRDLGGVDAAWRVLAFAGVGALLLLASWLYVRWARSEAA